MAFMKDFLQRVMRLVATLISIGIFDCATVDLQLTPEKLILCWIAYIMLQLQLGA